MNAELVALIAVVLAAIPCFLFLTNLFVYRSLPGRSRGNEAHIDSREHSESSDVVSYEKLSVLIPARNEEQNIRATLEAVLANRDAAFEAIVLDDHSTDRTAEIVSEMAERDSRLRLENAPPLPSGWCGKQHACHILASRARYPLLVFIDADVRLAPDALRRMVAFMESTDAALASGVPRQILGTFAERLLIPLIHFVLLGFLPMRTMRRTRWPSMSAGCGQLFIVRGVAYQHCGGHSMLRDSLHDGLKLPRVFRRAGFRTELFDATDIAACRMYQTNRETWRGLGKNATEGLAAPGTILPMTGLLLGGQVLPFVLLALAPILSNTTLLLAGSAAMLSLLPRVIAAKCFHQPWAPAFLHPLGVLALLSIQWQALLRSLAGKPSEWKGRSYGGVTPRAVQGHMTSAHLLLALAVVIIGAASSRAGESRPLPTTAPPRIDLRDQYDTPQTLAFPTTNVTVLTIADKKGAEQIHGWVTALKSRYGGRIELRGLADVGGVPGFHRGKVRKKFQETRPHPVMMDWSGKVCAQFGFQPGLANLFVIARDGSIHARVAGLARESALKEVCAAVDATLINSASVQTNSTPRPLSQ